MNVNLKVPNKTRLTSEDILNATRAANSQADVLSCDVTTFPYCKNH